ncbi:MAG TPA: IS3 family transposase [Candidatus Methylacidiphilales bacterium]|nr:IS3 family transposase [Candidatus Methylacidiphilales bacterium]
MKRLEVDHPVRVLAPAFGVSRSGYYRWRGDGAGMRAAEDARLKIEIQKLHGQSRGTYGRPRLVAALRRGGVRTSGRRVARLMRELGLRARRKGGHRVRTTESRHRLVRWPNRLRELAAPPVRPGVAWVSDMTYVRTREGWLYVAAVLDLASRRLLGLAMAPRLDASLPHAALRQALVRCGSDPRGVIAHSDQGVQYASDLYQQTLQRHGLLCSMSRRGHCTDNAHMESFWATLKTELLAGRSPASSQQTQTAIFEYVEVFYNRKRLHSALGFQSPVDYEQQLNYT